MGYGHYDLCLFLHKLSGSSETAAKADLHGSKKKKQNARTMDSSAGFFIILLDPPSRETN